MMAHQVLNAYVKPYEPPTTIRGWRKEARIHRLYSIANYAGGTVLGVKGISAFLQHIQERAHASAETLEQIISTPQLAAGLGLVTVLSFGHAYLWGKDQKYEAMHCEAEARKLERESNE